MQTKNLLESFDSIVAKDLRILIEVGALRYARSPATALKQRRSLEVQTDDGDFEILLWESGEVEFGYGTVDNTHEEHLDGWTAQFKPSGAIDDILKIRLGG